MNFYGSHSGLKKQQGIATLVTVLVLLIATTITAFTMTSSIVNEKQVVSEERRALSAFEAAQSGLATGIDTFRRTGTLPLIASAATGSISGGATWEYWQEPSGDNIILFAKGYSDDLSVERQVRMLIDFAKLDLPEISLVAGGVMTASGNLDITNTQGNLTIWSGDQVTLGGSASTTIPAPGYSECDENVSGSCIIASNKDYRGGDIVDSDPNLSGLSTTEFQRSFLGEPVSDFCESYIDVDGKSDSEILALAEAAGAKICLNSGTNQTIKPNLSIGSASAQKVLVIDGDFEVNSNTEFYGLLYVTGDINKANGNAKFYGSIVVQGDVDLGNGGFTVVFDSDFTSNLGDEAVTTAVAGTWRDW